jgi:hypothetical protein
MLAGIRCPACRAELGAHTCIDLSEAQPSPGDPSVCLYCASLCVFDDVLQLRFPTDEELEVLAHHPGVRVARATALAFIRDGGTPPGGW